MTQGNLFTYNGRRYDPAPECSAAARERVDANRLRSLTERVYLEVYKGGAIADEVVGCLREMGVEVDYFSIRPRVSELKAAGILVPTGARRLNAKGNTCAVLVHRDHREVR